MMSLTTRMPIEVLPAVGGVRRATQRIMGEEQPGGGGVGGVGQLLSHHPPVLCRGKLTFHGTAAASISSFDYKK